MHDFIVSKIEETKRYEIINDEEAQIFLTQKKEFAENPKKVLVLIHSYKRVMSSFERTLEIAFSRQILVSNIFLKNGKDFHVRLGARASFKNKERSLKNYTRDEINQIIHLRSLEKQVLHYQGDDQSLVYYQPNTARLQESIRSYMMLPVILDYSHISNESRTSEYVGAQEKSLDYVLAKEEFSTNNAINFKKAGRLVKIVENVY